MQWENPVWHPLSINSAAIVEPFFQDNQYLLSDYSLPSLLAWSSTGNQHAFFNIDDNILTLAVKSKQKEIRHLLLPLGALNVDAELLMSTVKRAGCPKFCAVPENLIGDNILAFFEHQEEEQNANYIYLAKELAQLRGNRFIAKRNHINAFIRNIVPHHIRVEPISAATVEECFRCLNSWREEKAALNTQSNEAFFDEEIKATSFALSTIEKLDWIMLLVRVHGDVCAFAIGSRLTKDTVTLNFEKALSAHRGLYQFLDREFANLVADKYLYINKEGDMGISGLRTSKESYRPQYKLRSFSLVLKDRAKVFD